MLHGWVDQLKLVASNQIETLIENNQRYTTQEIADIFKISKSIKFLMKMKNVSFILWEKLNKLFGQPNTTITKPLTTQDEKLQEFVSYSCNSAKVGEHVEWKKAL